MNFYGEDLTTNKDSLDGHIVFNQFLSADLCSDIDLELDAIYEVLFDVVMFGGRYQTKFVGLRKEVSQYEA